MSQPYQETKKVIDKLNAEENSLKRKLKEIEQLKRDIVFILLDKEELLSEKARKIWEEENDNQ